MANQRKHFESMLFDDITTNRTDFTAENARIDSGSTQKNYQIPKKTCMMKRPPPLKDVQAMTDWKNPVVPFDVYGKPKSITRTNPRDIQKPFTKLIDHDRKAVQMTRPRLIMTPAAGLDDFEDEEREKIIDYIYKSSAMEMSRFIGTTGNIEAPRPGQPAPPKPITIPQLNLPLVPHEWRMESVTWDGRQLRGACNPDAMFWLDRPPRCIKCDETKAVTAMRKNKTLK